MKVLITNQTGISRPAVIRLIINTYYPDIDKLSKLNELTLNHLWPINVDGLPFNSEIIKNASKIINEVSL